MNADRLDEFYWNCMKDAKHAKVCVGSFRIIFTLLHGQAAVKRGFSFNSELLVENLLAALCTVVSRVMLIISVSFLLHPD